jgi:hypothetical protein
LKRLKTDEKSFGNVWRFQARSLEIFGKSLEKAWWCGLVSRETNHEHHGGTPPLDVGP